MDTYNVIMFIIAGGTICLLIDLRFQVKALKELLNGPKIVERPIKEATPASAYIGSEPSRSPTTAKLAVPNRVAPAQFAPNLQSPPRPNGGFGSKT